LHHSQLGRLSRRCSVRGAVHELADAADRPLFQTTHFRPRYSRQPLATAIQPQRIEPVSTEPVTAKTPLRAHLSYPGLLLGAICLSMTIALLIGFQLTRKGIDEAALQD